MRILVSACLIGGLCKYNGKSNRSERVRRYLEGAEIIAVCPEVMGGLPIPRTPAEIVDGIVLSDNVSQLTHIIGGICGAVMGLNMRR